MKILVHRGAEQIGGNCIELQTTQTKILIDLGLPLNNKELSEVEQERLRQEAFQWIESVDAVFISHAHADHFGLLTELHRDIPVFMSRETKILIDSNPYNTIDLKGLNVVVVPIRTSFGFKDIRVTTYTVDHSAYGANAFYFEAEGKSLLYTGDIRTHSVKGKLYKYLPQNPDYLLIEGTNVGQEDKPCCKEESLVKKFETEFRKSPNAIHTVWCSSQNIDRIVTVFKACKHTGKQLVVDSYTADVLNRVAETNKRIPHPKGFEDVKIYFPHRVMESLTKIDKPRYTYRLNPIKNKVTYTDANFKDNARNYVFIVRTSVMDFLAKVKKVHPEMKFTVSTWEGYWDDPDTKKTVRFRKWMEENCEVTAPIHTSGHADVQGLKDIIAHVSPKTVIPIHTENAASYKKVLGLSLRVKVLKDSEVFVL